jgi:serine/threonine protein kinase
MAHPANFRLAAAELACEAHMLASFDHPNILKVRGWAYNGISSFEDGWHDSFFLLLDLLDETLDQRIERWQSEEHQAICSSLISQSTGLPTQHSLGLADLWRRLRHPSSIAPLIPMVESHQPFIGEEYQLKYLEKLRIMMGIASALEYIHERGVIFRDLKPNNIGFLGDRVQLFDFGLSRELPALDTSVPFEMSGKVGTLRYMAPEVALHQPYNIAADVYSWAIVSYEMLSLQKPFNNWTRDMHANLVCSRGVRPDTAASAIPLDMRVFLEHAWQTSASERPTVSNIAAQLQCFNEQQLLILEEQQLQRQCVQLEVQAATAMYIDMTYCMSSNPQRKLYRSHSMDSIETIETSSLSGDSQNS